MDEDLIGSTVARSGHFLLESGHHGNLWLDLELLCLRPRQIEGAVAGLAQRLRAYRLDAVCGPLNEGAFLALRVAAHLDVGYTYAERREQPGSAGLFPVEYRIPGALRARLQDRRVGIVNDEINAGSAVRGTHADLLACGAVPVALAAFLVLGDAAQRFADATGMELICLDHRPNEIWTPAECPLCAAGVPLQNP